MKRFELFIKNKSFCLSSGFSSTSHQPVHRPSNILNTSTTYYKMSNITSTLAKRLRARSISLVSQSQHTVFSMPLNVDTMKQRTADWEPTINLKDLRSKTTVGNGDDNDADVAQMVTYSAIDPGASHPLLLSSALPISMPSLSNNASTDSTVDHRVKHRRTASAVILEVQNPSTTSSLQYAVEVQQATPVAPAAPVATFKPWPYSLPKALQPKVGTTYDMVYGDGDGVAKNVKVGLLQKVLYGDPEPGVKVDADEKGNEGRKKGLLGEILQHVQEEVGKAGC